MKAKLDRYKTIRRKEGTTVIDRKTGSWITRDNSGAVSNYGCAKRAPWLDAMDGREVKV